jgi:hypothetical protein
MQPIDTVPSIARRAVDEGDSGVTSPNSGTPEPGGTDPPGCAGTEFEPLEDALRKCESTMPKSSDLPAGLKDKLEVRITSSALSTPPGGRADLTITLRNKSGEPLALYFTGDPSPRFEVEAVDSKGRRVDLPPGKQPAWPKGVSPAVRDVKASRITLLAGGTARAKVVWAAVRTRWAPELLRAKGWDGRAFPRVSAGSLAPGKYTLRFSLPLVFEKGALDVPKFTMDVGAAAR